MATLNYQLLTWDGAKQKRIDSQSTHLKLGSLSIGELSEIKEVDGKLDFGALVLTNLGTPTAASDAATKGYVDAAAASALFDAKAYTDAEVAAEEARALAREAELQAEIDGKISSTMIGAANGVAPLGSDSKIPASYLPVIAISEVYVVNTLAERDALIVQTGDVAKVVQAVLASDGVTMLARAYVYDGSQWIELNAESDVDSVNGKVGHVVLNTGDVAEFGDSRYFTAAREAEIEADIAAAVAAEASARSAADAALQAEIDEIELDLAAEISRATAAEAALSAEIAQVESDLEDEIEARTEQYMLLDGKIDSEIARATAAEGSLRTDLDAEIATRTSEDAAIRAEIDAIEESLSGFGDRTVTASSAGSIAAGQVVKLTSSGQVSLASKTDSLFDAGVYIATTAIPASGTGKVALSEGKVLGGYTGLIPGKKCFVGSAGGLVQSLAGFVAGESVYCVGRAVSATELVFSPGFEFEY